VPFGGRRTTGYMLGRISSGGEGYQIILDILDETPLFPAGMIPLFRWTAEYYKHPLGAVIQTALPGGLDRSESAAWTITEEGRGRLEENDLPPTRPAFSSCWREAPAAA